MMSKFPNIEVSFDYDEDTDVLHISLNTGEPSYCEETDDIVLVERGFYSRQITGFQVMDIRFHGIKQVELQTKIKDIMPRVERELERDLTRLQKARTKNLTSLVRDLPSNPNLGSILQSEAS
ncbi:DUF2283 domain-containing protein [Gemmatimonas aurantiaca]|nr:DUF2283 domain-containing protein [Gemmatimonas aurantiaca]